jgi:pimeloyl-ACP methyl ester carboxylesterase
MFWLLGIEGLRSIRILLEATEMFKKYGCMHLISIWVVFSLCACNHPVFYQPRPYQQSDLAAFRATPGAKELEYQTATGRQIAFYLAPVSDVMSPRGQVWILFGGISSLALEWLPWLRDAPRAHTGYLLIDYPGYGLNEGVPRAKGILESSLAALEALAVDLKIDQRELEAALNVLGHSLGTGTVLQFAVHVQVDKIILVAPFTDLRDLTTYRYGDFAGGFLNLINTEKYDNVQRLDELAARRHPPRIFIFHGDSDHVIAVKMGRELARRYPTLTTYYELKGVGHSDLFADHMPLILDVISARNTKP